MQKYVSYSIYIALLILFFVTRLWSLDILPYGIHCDEAGMAYDAWCLANFGVDRYLKSWPIYLNNYGSGQSILYCYLCAVLFKFFEYTPEIMRTPAVIFSFFTFIFGIKICNELYPKQKSYSMLCGLLIIVCPYFILAGRFGLDCNLMLGASTMFLYFFIKAINTNRKGYYFASGIIGGVTLYTYALSYIIMPFFLLMSVAYLIRTKKFHFKKWVIMGIPMGILAFPLVLVQYINLFDKPEMQLGIFTITRMSTYRVSEISAFTWDKFLATIKCIFVGDNLNYNSVEGFLNLYGITIIFCGIGLFRCIYKLVASIRKRNVNFWAFPTLWFFCVVFFESHIAVNINKINSIYFVTVLIAIEGIAWLCTQVKKISSRMFVSMLAISYLICFLRFGNYYYNGAYTYENYPLDYFDITVSEAVEFLEEHVEYQNQGVYMSGATIYYALSSLQSPYEMEFSGEMENVVNGYYICGGLPDIDSNYNYIVRDVYPEFAQRLRLANYTEIPYDGYSLFFIENNN